MPGNRSPHTLFSKHLFRSGCRCPTKLYYYARSSTYPQKKDHLPFLEHIRFNKQQLRKLLELQYPDAEHIGSGSRRERADETARFLKEDFIAVFDACLIHETLYARVPLLEKDGEKVRVFYLQTKGFDPDHHSLTDRHGKIHSKWRGYLRDFSYLLHVIRKEHPDWKLDPYLVLPDRSAGAEVDRLDQKLAAEADIAPAVAADLLVFVPVIEQIKRFWSGEVPLLEEENEPVELDHLTYEEKVARLAEWYQQEERVSTGIGKKCARCEFRVDADDLQDDQESGFEECWQQVMENPKGDNHIFDLIGSGNNQLLADQVYSQTGVSLEEKLTPQQIAEADGNISDLHRRILQIAKAKGQEVPREIIKPQLYDELNMWRFPLHFLDFEAGSYAVPLRVGRRPYDMVIFQFSCHTLYRDGALEHRQWLHPGDETYPHFQLVGELRKVPGLDEGTIVHYSGFERAALRRLQGELQNEQYTTPYFGEQLRFLQKITSNGSEAPGMADLGRLVKNCYYNAEMEDSLSIKDVLHATMKVSPVLKQRFSKPYHSTNFDGQIWWRQEAGEVLNPYKILVGDQRTGVGQGTEAMVAYARMRTPSYDEAELAELRRSLFRYCELDTLALVMIYLHWRAPKC